MDILAHGLWAAAGAKVTGRFTKKKIRVGRAALFGVLPDLFAFTVLTFWFGSQLFFHDLSIGELPRPSEVEPSAPDTIWIFRITSLLYSMSHSLFVFAAVFLIVATIYRRVVWELFGWLFHIFVDVFSHSYSFYPTPVLWPVSAWRFDGFPWDEPMFFTFNYSLLVLIYVFWYRKFLKKLMVKAFRGLRGSRKEHVPQEEFSGNS